MSNNFINFDSFDSFNDNNPYIHTYNIPHTISFSIAEPFRSEYKEKIHKLFIEGRTVKEVKKILTDGILTEASNDCITKLVHEVAHEHDLIKLEINLRKL